MKHEFRLTRPAFILKHELSAGALLATIETPDGLPLDRVLHAIALGHATAHVPEAPATAAKPPEKTNPKK